MKECVDKQISHEFLVIHVIVRCLFLSHFEADNYFSSAIRHRVGEHVGNV